MPIRGDRLRWPPRPGKRSAERSSGTRETLSTDDSKPAPRQPNERDESADSQASGPREIIQRAHDDVVEGKTDTDCRGQAAEIVKRNEKSRRNP